MLNEFPILIRSNLAISIVHKVLKAGIRPHSNYAYPRNPFGFATNYRGREKYQNGDIEIITSVGTQHVPRKDVTKNTDIIDSYKILIGRLVPSNGELDVDPKDGYKVITDTRLIGPGQINTETYLDTETENGQKDYYWGHYHSSGQTAEKDFAKRVSDYKELFGVHERTEGHEQAEYYRYYSTQRPVDLGTFPKPPGNAPVEIINFDERRMVEGGTMRAWGELAYWKPLTEKQMEDYELRPAPGNPDRAARPSITAQLKEAARRAEPPKEPDKAKHSKSREDR